MASSSEAMKELRKRLAELKAVRATRKQSISVVTDAANEKEHKSFNENAEQECSPTASEEANPNPELDKFAKVRRASFMSTSSVEQILAGEKSELIKENYNIKLEYEKAKKENKALEATRNKTLEEMRVRLETAERKLAEEQLLRTRLDQELEEKAKRLLEAVTEAENRRKIEADAKNEERIRLEAAKLHGEAEARLAETRAAVARAAINEPTIDPIAEFCRLNGLTNG
jgi:hypothetical protein